MFRDCILNIGPKLVVNFLIKLQDYLLALFTVAFIFTVTLLKSSTVLVDESEVWGNL